MLFNYNKDVFESEKERNLYYKFFAGFFFNELVEGYDDRMSALSDYLTKSFCKEVLIEKPSISFDNHAYRFGYSIDSGEFADILINETTNKTMVAVEAKYLSDWSVGNDLKDNLDRIDHVRMVKKNYQVHYALLVSKMKWMAAEKKKNSPNSNYSEYLSKYKDLVRIIFWDDLIEICDNSRVTIYMNQMLGQKKSDIVVY